MSTVAYVGRGSTLSVETSISPVTYTEVGQLQKFAMSGIKVTTDDVTNLDSPSAFKEIIGCLIDPGDVSFNGILDPANTSQVDMLSYCQAMTLQNFQIKLSDKVTKVTFSGLVTEWVPAVVETTKAISFSGKITITGPVSVGS